MNASIAALRRRVAGGEGGFTITELAAALAVLLVALIGLARTATIAFSDVSNARQRQTGSQLANQILEEVRGLPFDTVEKGLATSGLDSDPAIVRCAGNVYRYASCSGEEIVHTAYPAGTSISPLVPNSGSVGPPEYPSTYAWRTYVTELAGAPAEGAYRVIVTVDWTGAARPGLRSDLELETYVYSPEGCIDTASHPFGAPCQPYYYGTGSVGGGTLAVSGPFSADGGNSGADYDSMTATLLGETADAQIEQVSLVQGNVSLPQLARVVDGIESSVPDGAVSAADSDPSTPTGSYQRQTAGPQSGSSFRVQDGPDRMDLVLGSNSSGETTSTTAAGGANACNLQIDGKQCGYASATQSGATTLEARLQDGGDATLFSVGTLGSTPVTTYLRRYQPVASEDGLLRETVTWALPEIRVGGLPADLGAPSGWAGYWFRLRDFSATAVAEAGTGTSAPTVTISGGAIDYWHGNGYNSVTVADPVTGAARTQPFTVPINSFQRQVTSQGSQLRVEISGTVTIDPSAVAEVITTGNTRTEAQATIGSPVVADVSYVVLEDGNTVHDLTFEVTGGQGVATTTYRPTPAG